MSSHADTIKDALVARLWVGKYRTEPGVPAALESLDALLAENQRLREKVVRVECLVAAGHIADGISVSSARVIREALAGDTE